MPTDISWRTTTRSLDTMRASTGRIGASGPGRSSRASTAGPEGLRFIARTAVASTCIPTRGAGVRPLDRCRVRRSHRHRIQQLGRGKLLQEGSAHLRGRVAPDPRSTGRGEGTRALCPRAYELPGWIAPLTAGDASLVRRSIFLSDL